MEEFVRVLGPLHPQNPDPEPGLLQHGNGPLGGALPGLVPVVDEDHPVGVPGQEGGVVLRQGRAQRGHGAVKAELVQGHGVHVPLHQNDLSGLGFFRQVHGEQVLSLVKNQSLRGI